MTWILALLRALRPKQWTKNGLLLAAPVFAQRWSDPDALLRVGLGMVFFSMLSSAGYLVNDLRDVEADRLHPKKAKRPIASGAVPVALARGMVVVLTGLGLLGAWWLGRGFLLTAGAYLVTTLSYTIWFKHAAVLDVMLIATGFILRAVAGAEAISVPSSPWFLTCTAFGALFIGLVKRLAEIRLLEGNAAAHREVLQEYTPFMLEQFISVASACTLISYALYTFEGGQTRALMLTLPCVIYGMFRYLYLVEQLGQGGEPENTLFQDKPMLACIALFGLTAVLALRFGAVGG
jgi:4-hydroxybenzoate polyprenyltransferase